MKFSEVQNKKILYSCLNWGMGHVSRSIGLIHMLLDQENEIIVVGSSDQIRIFETYFSDIQTLELEGYPFEFENYNSFQQAIWKQKWQLKRFMNYEKKWVDDKVKEFGIDLVLSDHRYGFRSSYCNSIFITHQIHLPLKGIYKIFELFHSYWIKQFNSVWIIDYAENNLAGKLSSPGKLKNFEFIGWFSRFQLNLFPILNQKKKISILLLNGPNVHLDFLFRYYLTHSKKTNRQIIIGNPSAFNSLLVNEDIDCIESKNWLEIDELLSQATEIFSFFGYSTLMDAKFLSAEFHLIPCPSQWEQEYLSTIHPKINSQK